MAQEIAAPVVGNDEEDESMDGVSSMFGSFIVSPEDFDTTTTPTNSDVNTNTSLKTPTSLSQHKTNTITLLQSSLMKQASRGVRRWRRRVFVLERVAGPPPLIDGNSPKKSRSSSTRSSAGSEDEKTVEFYRAASVSGADKSTMLTAVQNKDNENTKDKDKDKAKDEHIRKYNSDGADEGTTSHIQILYGKAHSTATKMIQIKTVVGIEGAKGSVKWPTLKVPMGLENCFTLHVEGKDYNLVAANALDAIAWKVLISIHIIISNHSSQSKISAVQMLSLCFETEQIESVLTQLSSEEREILEKLPQIRTQLANAAIMRKRNLLQGCDTVLVDAWLKGERPQSVEESNTMIDSVWRYLDKSVLSKKDTETKSPMKPRTDWVNVRVFVSSTFADMHAEREVLVHQVFPRLNAWGEDKKIRFFHCDLRWGVPVDSTVETGIRTCLTEIDGCADVDGGNPFFLCLLSERYGWTPAGSDVPELVLSDFGWVPFSSMTHMEIVHMLKRSPHNPNAFFFMKDPSFRSEVPEAHKKFFIDTESLEVAALARLKLELQARIPKSQCKDYSCHVDGVETLMGVEKVKMSGLGPFADQCFEQLVQAASTQYGADALPVSSSQHLVSAPQGQVCFGRQSELETIQKFVTHPTLKTLWLTSEVNERTRKNKQVGRSAVLTMACNHFENDDAYETMYYKPFNTSSDVKEIGAQFSRRIIALHNFLTRTPKTESVDEAEVEATPSEKDVVAAIEGIKQKSNKQFILFLEGMNHYTVEGLFDKWPVKIVARSQGNDNLKATDVDNVTPTDVVSLYEVKPMSKEAREEFVTHRLRNLNKKLDQTQLDHLIENSGSESPEWLGLACNELCHHGVFETINQKLMTLAPTLEQLQLQSYKRIARDDKDDGLLCIALYFVGLSQGLLEQDFRPLLRKMLIMRSKNNNSATTTTTTTTTTVTDDDDDDSKANDKNNNSNSETNCNDNNNDNDLVTNIRWAFIRNKIHPLLDSTSGRYTLSYGVLQIVAQGILSELDLATNCYYEYFRDELLKLLPQETELSIKARFWPTPQMKNNLNQLQALLFNCNAYKWFSQLCRETPRIFTMMDPFYRTVFLSRYGCNQRSHGGAFTHGWEQLMLCQHCAIRHQSDQLCYACGNHAFNMGHLKKKENDEHFPWVCRNHAMTMKISTGSEMMSHCVNCKQFGCKESMKECVLCNQCAMRFAPSGMMRKCMFLGC